jgi:hypothetical protein
MSSYTPFSISLSKVRSESAPQIENRHIPRRLDFSKQIQQIEQCHNLPMDLDSRPITPIEGSLEDSPLDSGIFSRSHFGSTSSSSQQMSPSLDVYRNDIPSPEPMNLADEDEIIADGRRAGMAPSGSQSPSPIEVHGHLPGAIKTPSPKRSPIRSIRAVSTLRTPPSLQKSGRLKRAGKKLNEVIHKFKQPELSPETQLAQRRICTVPTKGQLLRKKMLKFAENGAEAASVVFSAVFSEQGVLTDPSQASKWNGKIMPDNTEASRKAEKEVRQLQKARELSKSLSPSLFSHAHRHAKKTSTQAARRKERQLYAAALAAQSLNSPPMPREYWATETEAIKNRKRCELFQSQNESKD